MEKTNRIIMGITVNGERFSGSVAPVLAASAINRKAGYYATYCLDVVKALEKTGKAVIHGCKVSYYYL